jgi:seryl-tRNA synthetase
MLDIRLLREQPDFVKSRLATRGGDEEVARIDEVLRVDAERRKAETALQQLNADRKRLSKEIGGKRARGESSEELEGRVREIGDQISLLNEQTSATDERQKTLLLGIPNLPHAQAPIGQDASANPVVRTWSEKPKLGDKVLDHIALGTKLKLFDLDRATNCSYRHVPSVRPREHPTLDRGTLAMRGEGG